MLKTKFSAILFDKDGTIFDSEQVSCDAWVACAKRFNVEFTPQMFNEFIGVPTDECFAIAHKRFGKDFPIGDFKSMTRDYINEKKANGLPQKAGFSDFIGFAQSLNIPLGIVTSAGRESTTLSFQKTDFESIFNIVVTVEDVQSPKPAPDCYLLACEKLGVAPENTLVFEDSNLGLQAAINAGCYTVAIPDIVDIEENIAQRCKHIIKSFHQAYDILK